MGKLPWSMISTLRRLISSLYIANFCVMKNFIKVACFLFFLFRCMVVSAQTDTLRVMAYNVLDYGELPVCQGPLNQYHAYLDTIVKFANPDILSLEKMGSIKFQPSDFNYSAQIDFQDSILAYALNPAYPGRYYYCPFTNYAGANTFSMLFYDSSKLGFIAITCNYASAEDFNTYKLYYKDPALPTTHDTTYLYVTVNHTISGNSEEASRGLQIANEMAQIQTHFTHLANMINMGDFNVRNTSEPLYQTLTNPSDTDFRYYDPPFYPDHTFTVPADWDNNSASYTSYLTTSTRELGDVPNSCGTNGGAKDWYDHIFLSPWIVNNQNYIRYIPNSFHVLGNDGHRLGISVNDPPMNSAVPANIANCLFQMSNKYPVIAELLVSSNTTGTSLPDPQITPVAVHNLLQVTDQVTVLNPVQDQLVLNCTDGLLQTSLRLVGCDMLGRVWINESVAVSGPRLWIPVSLAPGVYTLKVYSGDRLMGNSLITKY